MAATSRDRVTITLGPSGQVVKRKISSVDASFGDSEPLVGMKRSVRDRLGSGGGDAHSNGNLLNGSKKRQRGYMASSSTRANGLEGIEQGDLRLKLMKKKSELKQHLRNGDLKYGEDLRDKLRKTRQMSALDSLRRENSGGAGQSSSARSSDNFPKMDSHRDVYSHWPSDRHSHRSPDMIPHHSRGLSPQRSTEDIQRRHLTSRPFEFMSKDVIDTKRPMASASFQSGSVFPPGPLKPLATPLLSQIPSQNDVMPKSSFVVEEPQTVDALLHTLGLGKYVVIFKAEEVDMTALKQMGENDLKELGIPMGPRKKIILALLPRSKRHA